MEFLTAHWLDILTTILGLAYILLEYRASIWMWLVGFLMQALGCRLSASCSIIRKGFMPTAAWSSTTFR